MNSVGITLGDPAGIGPELVARALALDWGVPLRVYADRAVLERAATACGVAVRWGTFELVEPLRVDVVEAGSRSVGAAQVAYLEAALKDWRSLSAICTAPIHKAAAKLAGFSYPGHTEMLAACMSETSTPLPVTMMLAGPKLRVALATTHIALANVPRALERGGIERAIVHTAEALPRWFGIAQPRIAVAGLNPHAGESGHFGDEEARVVAPAMERAGVRSVSGPHVPDAVFRDAVEGKYDAVVALYHDQGLIPVKLVDFDEAVNVTLGLPILRTSPDHGVAYDIAGRGIARETSFRAALTLAVAAARRGGARD